MQQFINSNESCEIKQNPFDVKVPFLEKKHPLKITRQMKTFGGEALKHILGKKICSSDETFWKKSETQPD